MPHFIQEALRTKKLENAYRSRPAYQKNDYIGWIIRAKRPATRQKRLNQMLNELEGGTKYMNMNYQGG